MTTYVYEIIPSQAGQTPEYIELQQEENEAALTRHPQTGQPIRRVVIPGHGALGVKAPETSGSKGKGGCGCGPKGCC